MAGVKIEGEVGLSSGTQVALAAGTTVVLGAGVAQAGKIVPVNSSGLEFTDVIATSAVKNIDIVHAEIHLGYMWRGTHSFTALADNASVDLRLLTGTGLFHMAASFDVGGAGRVYLYEAPTISAGTAVAMYNLRRDVATACPLTLTHGPTVTATGSVALVNGYYIPGGASPTTRVGAVLRGGGGDWWLLKGATEHLIRFTNLSGGNISGSITIEGYTQ